MQLALTPEEAAFRDELRTFYRTKIPEEIRERTRLGAEVSREYIVTSHKILNDNGLAVPNWPVEWGGKDWIRFNYDTGERYLSVPDFLPE